MTLDRANAHRQRPRDLAVRQPGGREAGHPGLALGQLTDRCPSAADPRDLVPDAVRPKRRVRLDERVERPLEDVASGTLLPIASTGYPQREERTTELHRNAETERGCSTARSRCRERGRDVAFRGACQSAASRGLASDQVSVEPFARPLRARRSGARRSRARRPRSAPRPRRRGTGTRMVRRCRSPRAGPPRARAGGSASVVSGERKLEGTERREVPDHARVGPPLRVLSPCSANRRASSTRPPPAAAKAMSPSWRPSLVPRSSASSRASFASAAARSHEPARTHNSASRVVTRSRPGSSPRSRAWSRSRSSRRSDGRAVRRSASANAGDEFG